MKRNNAVCEQRYKVDSRLVMWDRADHKHNYQKVRLNSNGSIKYRNLCFWIFGLIHEDSIV